MWKGGRLGKEEREEEGGIMIPMKTSLHIHKISVTRNVSVQTLKREGSKTVRE